MEKRKMYFQILEGGELALFIALCNHTDKYKEIRKKVLQSEITDPLAKKIFISLEECFLNNKLDTMSVLANVNDEVLMNSIIKDGETIYTKCYIDYLVHEVNLLETYHNQPETKKCAQCKTLKPISDFYELKKKPGHIHICKECCAKNRKKGSAIHVKNHYGFTENQHKILSIIEDCYKNYGTFPTQEKIAEKLNISKQRVSQVLSKIDTSLSEPSANLRKPKVAEFVGLLKTVKTGWVSYKVCLESGYIADEKVSFRELVEYTDLTISGDMKEKTANNPINGGKTW